MKPSVIVAVLVAGVLVVLTAMRFDLIPGALPAKAPPVLGRVPDFHLVSDDGRAFDSAGLRGRPWLASFLYTSCPGPCPRLVERLKIVRRAIAPERLAIVSFSVDPAADTPAVLADYKTARGITADQAWTFVTGPPEEVLELVQRGFLTGVERGSGDTDEGAVSHGVRVALIDGERAIRGFYSTESDEELARLERDVAALPSVTYTQSHVHDDGEHLRP